MHTYQVLGHVVTDGGVWITCIRILSMLLMGDLTVMFHEKNMIIDLLLGTIRK